MDTRRLRCSRHPRNRIQVTTIALANFSGGRFDGLSAQLHNQPRYLLLDASEDGSRVWFYPLEWQAPGCALARTIYERQGTQLPAEYRAI